MDREIKFRGFDPINKKFVFGYYWQTKIATYITSNRETEHQDIAVLTETVGQYTGLKDKNGKEIYEGDIIKCNDGIIGQVKYKLQAGAWWIVWKNHYKELTDTAQYFDKTGLFLEGIELIGNIYENPELQPN